ncbi:hypothetical protein ACFTS5_06340 [Nocardia sp. NPDC056952]|uniref:hypothetical protein n=1 Tax=Nocardia sp. NPDC056952 TaxID=3345979 RepID=UPI00363FFFB0
MTWRSIEDQVSRYSRSAPRQIAPSGYIIMGIPGNIRFHQSRTMVMIWSQVIIALISFDSGIPDP